MVDEARHCVSQTLQGRMRAPKLRLLRDGVEPRLITSQQRMCSCGDHRIYCCHNRIESITARPSINISNRAASKNGLMIDPRQS